MPITQGFTINIVKEKVRLNSKENYFTAYGTVCDFLLNEVNGPLRMGYSSKVEPVADRGMLRIRIRKN